MPEFFRRTVASSAANPQQLWVNVISNCLITAAFFCIALTLLYVVRRYSDRKARKVILMIACLIVAGAAARGFSVWTVWHPGHRWRGLTNMVTAAISVVTALVALKLAPAVLRFSEMTAELREEIEARDQAEAKLRAHIQAELLASEDKLRSCFEAASQAILGVAGNGRISLVNRRTEEMFGYSREELLGQDLELLLPERFRASHVAHRDGYFAEPRVRAMGAGMELAGRRRDGTEFPIEIGLSHVITSEGTLAFGMVSDISERRKVEAELLASKDKLDSLFEAAPQGILGVSGDGRISMVNRRTEEMFGYSRSELLGQELELLLPERLRSGHVARRDGYFSEPRVRAMGAGMDLAGRRKNGSEFPLEIGLSHVNTPEGPLAFGMVTDISERKRTADDLHRVNEDLRRSNIEIEQFAHVASHDLQEPLRMVTGYLQLIERRYSASLDANAREFIGFAVDGAKRMKALIKDLLEFSRAGTHTGKFRKIDLRSVIENSLGNLKIAIDESGAQITVDPLPTIVGDSVLLTQVFQNLIANAIKFQKDSVPRVHISAQLEKTMWTFSVRDNGIGIEAGHLDRIFRIFERLHSIEQYAGSGIGLAIARKIVERHHGKIWVESEIGSGSTFFFSLSAEMGIESEETEIGLSATS